jgi:hypothetical protein
MKVRVCELYQSSRREQLLSFTINTLFLLFHVVDMPGVVSLEENNLPVVVLVSSATSSASHPSPTDSCSTSVVLMKLVHLAVA